MPLELHIQIDLTRNEDNNQIAVKFEKKYTTLGEVNNLIAELERIKLALIELEFDEGGDLIK